MKKNKITILLAVIALLLASLACNAVTGGGESGDNNNGGDGISFTTANITKAHMALDVDDTKQTDVFSPSAKTFYCFFDLNNAPDDTKVKGVWVAVDASGVDPNYEIDTSEYTSGDGTIYFTLERSTDAWPVGKYKVDLYINDKLVQTIEFEVK